MFFSSLMVEWAGLVRGSLSNKFSHPATLQSEAAIYLGHMFMLTLTVLWYHSVHLCFPSKAGWEKTQHLRTRWGGLCLGLEDGSRKTICSGSSSALQLVWEQPRTYETLSKKEKERGREKRKKEGKNKMSQIWRYRKAYNPSYSEPEG